MLWARQESTCKADALETLLDDKLKANVFSPNRVISPVHTDGLYFYLRTNRGDESKKKKFVKCDMKWILYSGEESVVWSGLLQCQTLYGGLISMRATSRGQVRVSGDEKAT
jgi:hypothetical protein